MEAKMDLKRIILENHLGMQGWCREDRGSPRADTSKGHDGQQRLWPLQQWTNEWTKKTQAQRWAGSDEWRVLGAAFAIPSYDTLS